MYLYTVEDCLQQYCNKRTLQNHIFNIHQIYKCMFYLKYQPCGGFLNHAKEHHQHGHRVLQNRHYTYFFYQIRAKQEQLYGVQSTFKKKETLPIVLKSQQRNLLFPSEYTPTTDIASHKV
ncbi:hypothetical protein ACQKWADRAFT_301626, partial [Trichoderma austrokoningii]